MNSRLLVVSLLGLLWSGLRAQEVKSPDGMLTVKLTLEAGRLTYEVAREGHPALGELALELLERAQELTRSPDR